MTNSEYWKKRAEERKNHVSRTADEAAEEARESFERARHRINREVAYWIQKFADAEGISYDEARKMLEAGELEQFRMTLGEYIARGKALDVDPEWQDAMVKASALHHIDRLNALKAIIRAELEENKARLKRSQWMHDIADYSYEYTLFGIETGLEMQIRFRQPDLDRLHRDIEEAWAQDGIDFVDRVGINNDKLAAEVDRLLTQGMITGETYEELAKQLTDQFALKEYEAARIIRTEATRVASMSEAAAYRTAGLEEYEILVTLDERTCNICGPMDGHVERVDDMEPGVTAPPFHPNCRCTTIGHYEDGLIDETRIARDEDGNPIHVDGDMTWEEWKAQYRGQDREGDIKPLTQDPNRRILDSQRSLFQEEPNVSIPEKFVGDFADFNELTIQEQEKVALREMKEITARSGFEYGKIIHEGGETRYFTSKMESSVKIPDNLSSMKGAHVLHTHSNVTPFSAKDFRLLTRDNVERLTVIAGNGDVYSVTIGEGYRPDIEEYIEASDRIRALVDMEMMSRPEFFDWTPEERVYMATKEQAFQTARYFKWNLEGGRI